MIRPTTKLLWKTRAEQRCITVALDSLLGVRQTDSYRFELSLKRQHTIKDIC